MFSVDFYCTYIKRLFILAAFLVADVFGSRRCYRRVKNAMWFLQSELSFLTLAFRVKQLLCLSYALSYQVDC